MIAQQYCCLNKDNTNKYANMKEEISQGPNHRQETTGT